MALVQPTCFLSGLFFSTLSNLPIVAKSIPKNTKVDERTHRDNVAKAANNLSMYLGLNSNFFFQKKQAQDSTLLPSFLEWLSLLFRRCYFLSLLFLLCWCLVVLWA